MSGDITGRPVNAVLVAPQAERFASLVGVDLGRLCRSAAGTPAAAPGVPVGG